MLSTQFTDTQVLNAKHSQIHELVCSSYNFSRQQRREDSEKGGTGRRSKGMGIQEFNLFLAYKAKRPERHAGLDKEGSTDVDPRQLSLADR